MGWVGFVFRPLVSSGVVEKSYVLPSIHICRDLWKVSETLLNLYLSYSLILSGRIIHESPWS